MIKIKNLTVRNFMSVGNQTQAIDFDKGMLTLVLGENLDLGGDDSGARNGTGKTTIINSLSYAIYGVALTNIKRDNLINKINSKGMLVTVSFEKNGVNYHIERGRKPNILKLNVDGEEYSADDADESQGDSRQTQKEIEKLFGMSHDMFKHLIALNTYTEPFLALKNNDQRTIIEQLLGITILSEKADALKEQVRISKDLIQQENTKIETIKVSNQKIEESIQSLERKQKLWQDNHTNDVNDLSQSIRLLEKIDIDAEIDAHKCLENFNEKKKRLEEAQRWIANIEADNTKQEKTIAKLDKEILLLKEHKCHACGQEIHDTTQEEILKSKEDQKQEAALQVITNNTQWEEHSKVVSDIGELETCPPTQYDSLEEAVNHRSTLASLQKELEKKQEETNRMKNRL